MALPASGPISLGDVNVELGLARTLTIHLGATGVRTLYNVPTGEIRLAADGYGKANRVALSYVFSANTTQTTVTASSIVGYVAGKTDLTITINAGVIVTSTSTAAPTITITGAAVGDTITIVNNGYIFGMGGTGGNGGSERGTDQAGGGQGLPGGGGGPAIQLTSLTGIPLTVRNNGVIGGGSGGGGGGGIAQATYFSFGTGYIVDSLGGGGGGGGIINGPGGNRGFAYFWGGGNVGAAGAGTPPAYTPGAGGARYGRSVGFTNLTSGAGGGGGRLGSAGSVGEQGVQGSYRATGGAGGLAGKAINLNGAVYTAAATAVNLSSVVIGAGGTFTCAATTIRFGQQVTITGTNTGTGSITGYVSGTVYYVIATNGSTTFTLSATWNGTAIASTAGTPVGLTFSLNGTTAGVIS
jgi:hypothetical protein